jgi:hypothetical protein
MASLIEPNLIQDTDWLPGSEAGQTVPHSHFHIIPRLGPARDATDITDAERRNLALGEGPRIKLNEIEGASISSGIKAALRQEIEKVQVREQVSGSDEELFINAILRTPSLL